MKILTKIIALVICVGPIYGKPSSKQSSPPAEQPKQVFTISRPTNGRYTPHRDKSDHWYAGEIITIKYPTFRYEYFTDVADAETPDYTGKIQLFEDHIFLNHPGVPYPYRVAGFLDGRSVLLSWEAYQSWKKNGRVSRGGILYLQKAEPDAQQDSGGQPAIRSESQ
ncbi:hypothetical protein JIN85_18110 [Luteolibacter pohnpeiensis]|uniref:Uncharacterized protein n=1 Tax=Luteolibacter pohnpeiensis TaxID=454153 RepID=A0A934S9K3_9BACT|nr:hypothetical protein [Luteolibacter pohnpeiensis]MBK1884338.1 hypothetical protein [Luteolibacter pohnpeiensis]